MRDTITDAVSRHLSATLGRSLDVASMSEDTQLSSIGLDSILAITTLIGLAEEFETDLEHYADNLATPGTIGDLISMVAMFTEKKHAA